MQINHEVFGSIPQMRWTEIYDDQEQELDIEKVLNIAKIKKQDIAAMSGLKKESVRLEPHRISAKVMERVREIATILELAAQYFKSDSERVTTWFITNNPFLGNISPRDMLRMGRYEKLHKFIMNSATGNRIP